MRTTVTLGEDVARRLKRDLAVLRPGLRVTRFLMLKLVNPAG